MNFELLIEAERRGILPPDKVELLAEARRRGLVPGATPTGAIPGAAPGMTAPARVGPDILEEPETTTAGVAGAMTRALALPVAGATAGRMCAGASQRR